MSSAQTSDENAGELAGDEYSDTAALAELEAAFIARFGEPTIQRDDVTAFTAANAAVRKDVPEALYYADSVAPLFEAQFNS